MITSRLDHKARTTLPRAVRRALSVVGGEEILYEIVGSTVVITKTTSLG